PLEQKALERVTFEINDLKVPLNAAQLVEALRKLHQAELDPEKRKLFDETRFTLDVNGQKTTLTGADLAQALGKMESSQIPAKLLRIEGPVVPDHEGINPRYTYVLLFILVMIVLWCGCNNAAKEIVKEEAIYGRERAVNLGILPYLASKFLVLSIITA